MNLTISASLDGTKGETEEKLKAVNRILKKRQLDIKAQTINKKKA